MHTLQQLTFMAFCTFPAHDVSVFVQQFYRKGMHIHFIKSLFHRSKYQFICRVGNAPCNTSEPSRHFCNRNHTNFSFCINGIMTDEKLIALWVYHTVGGSSSNAFRPNGLLHG